MCYNMVGGDALCDASFQGVIHISVLFIAICEDFEDDLNRLLSFIKQSEISAEVDSFASCRDFLSAFKPGKYDLVFFDIYMKDMTGIDAAKAIRESDKNIMIAFTTASPDHTREGYLVNAFRYMEKPIKPDDVKDALELALAKKKNRPTISITKAGGVNEDVPIDGIIFFEQQKHIIQMHTAWGITDTTHSARMDEIESRLPGQIFLRCHKSYIVNLDYVQTADKDTGTFLMENGARAYIRKGLFTKCKAALEQRRLNTLWGGL